jgi:hypothetical protein
MAQILTLVDEYGVIYQAMKVLPDQQLKIAFLEALAELEDSECHRTRQFPKTRLHKIKGLKKAIYRADIDKVSGWRIHVQYVEGQIHLKDIIAGQKHDAVLDVIKSKKARYE